MKKPETIDSVSLKGRNVIDNAGVDVGAVDELEIDTTTWGVTGLVVRIKRDVAARLPLEKPLMGEPRVALDPQRIERVGDNVLLNVSVSDIAGYLSERPTE